MQNEEVIHQIELSRLRPFPHHPFQDDAMQQTVECIRSYGVPVPSIVRPIDDGSYEIIAGYRRKHACELADISTMSAIVRDLNRVKQRSSWWIAICNGRIFSPANGPRRIR